MIELIVVIGILGILMAILVGTFGGSTESARAAKCMSNMRNLAMAVQSVGMESTYYPYAGSFDKKVKAGSDEKIQARGWISWSTKGAGGKYISPYDTDLTLREFSITNGTIWASMRGARESYSCPGHVRQMQKGDSGISPLWSYAMNAYFGWASKGTVRYHNCHGKGFRSFRRPDRHLLFAELPYAKMSYGAVEQDGGKLSDKAGDPILQYSGCEGGGNEAIGFNHKDGKNLVAHVCFVDGHVEKLRAPKTGDVKELTKWLCRPVDDKGQDFDISFDGKKYQKVQ